MQGDVCFSSVVTQSVKKQVPESCSDIASQLDPKQHPLKKSTMKAAFIQLVFTEQQLICMQGSSCAQSPASKR